MSSLLRIIIAAIRLVFQYRVTYDGNGIMSLYRSGSSIYIRLTRSFSKASFCELFCYFLICFTQNEQNNSSVSNLTGNSQSLPVLLVSVTAPTILSPTSTILAQPSSLSVSHSVHAPTNVSAGNIRDITVSPSI